MEMYSRKLLCQRLEEEVHHQIIFTVTNQVVGGTEVSSIQVSGLLLRSVTEDKL